MTMAQGRAPYEQNVSQKTPEQVRDEARAGAFRCSNQEIISAVKSALRSEMATPRRGFTLETITEFLLGYGVRVSMDVDPETEDVTLDHSLTLAALKQLQRRGEVYLHDATSPGEPPRWKLTKE